MSTYKKDQSNSELLFFILIFLLLFYDGRALACFGNVDVDNLYKGDSTILFFILVFLELFYK